MKDNRWREQQRRDALIRKGNRGKREAGSISTKQQDTHQLIPSNPLLASAVHSFPAEKDKQRWKTERTKLKQEGVQWSEHTHIPHTLQGASTVGVEGC